MHHAFRFWLMVLGGLLLTSTSAMASKVVVPPLVPRGVAAQTADNMTTLIASELEFTGEFETVIQLATRPSQLGTNCLGSTPCLSGIAKAKGSTSLLGGMVTKYGTEFEVSLTYVNNARIVRTVKRKMSTDPAIVADEVAVLVRHALTGVDPEVKAQADKVSGFEGGGIALMDEEDEEDDDALLLAAPSVGFATADDPLGSPEDDLMEFEEDPNEGGEAYGYVPPVAAAPIRTPEPARARAPSRAEAADEFNSDDIDFGGSAEDISFGSAATMIQIDEPEEDPMEFETRRPYYADDLDEEQESRRSSRSPTRPSETARDRSTGSRDRMSSSRSATRSNVGAIGVTGRLGYGRFQYLNFITYGLEASFQVQDVLALTAGFDAHSTRRLIPPELVPLGQPAVQWNTLIPISLGLLYRPGTEDFRPYAGAGVSGLPGYVKGASTMAFGVHARGGADVLFSDNFGINLNLNAGLWAGTEWYLIQGLMNTGFTTQLSLGTVLAF